MVEVYYVLKAENNRILYQKNENRQLAYFIVKPHWSGKMPLNHLWQLYAIPEIDGDIKDNIKLTTVRKATDEEMEEYYKLTGIKK
jgi:hypothetical protein